MKIKYNVNKPTPFLYLVVRAGSKSDSDHYNISSLGRQVLSPKKKEDESMLSYYLKTCPTISFRLEPHPIQ